MDPRVHHDHVKRLVDPRAGLEQRGIKLPALSLGADKLTSPALVDSTLERPCGFSAMPVSRSILEKETPLEF